MDHPAWLLWDKHAALEGAILRLTNRTSPLLQDLACKARVSSAYLPTPKAVQAAIAAAEALITQLRNTPTL
jgi:hypothetical protein